ncbi:Calsenilin [Larimichthys crocea]|uniref:Uncharacterized protein n=1 Tax=Larimichthys crocea TaxID=215358 RepID=A0ACD3QNI9_LARCR|nr:Calsenilin [Larimichthys crocea]
MKGVVQKQPLPLTSSVDSEGISVGPPLSSRLTSLEGEEREEREEDCNDFFFPAKNSNSTPDAMQADEKVVDGGLLPDANGTDPNPGGQTDGSKWQKPRFSRKSLMKCCLVKWIIASTTQQGPGTGTS